jgi:hypothetical protein
MANFSTIATGSSIEGMGAVVPGLNIDAIGTAVKVAEGVVPGVFGAPNANPIRNAGLNPNGGFSDLVTKTALQAHQYTFTFAPGASITKFSLHMLDFGDFNPDGNLNHYASMTAYNANNVVVSKSELSYTATAALISPQYGDLSITGDYITASPGQPGNWTWEVFGPGIVKIDLSFGVGYDPNIAFDTLNFCPQAP